jgi:tetratricopeptide (TPR) repeat protein
VLRPIWLVVGILLAAAPGLGASPSTDPIGKDIGLTPESGSLPVWTKPSQADSQRLTQVVKHHQASILLVGSPKLGFGTAWVLSKANRLLATNAHVGDILHEAAGSMLAIANNTEQVYKIDRVWYHPGVVRRVSAGVCVRESDPAAGSVDPHSPDVAVLHVAEGPTLPDELPMATPAEVADLFAQPVAMLGFPGHDTSRWPGIGEKAVATLREGVVCRLSDFLGKAGVRPGQLQYVQHSMVSWFGFSGSPIFLTNGHVVALHNSARHEQKGAFQVELAYGIRIDCLWELVAADGLEQQVPIPVRKSELLLDRYQRPDPEMEKFQKAKRLVEEAGIAHFDHPDQAAAKYSEAIQLAPGYERAYRGRGGIYHSYSVRLWNAGDCPTPEGRAYAQFALADYKKWLELAPMDDTAYLGYCQALMRLSAETTGTLKNAEAVQLATKVLEKEALDPSDRARALQIRVEARGYPQSSLNDLNTAIALDPYNYGPYEARRAFWHNNRDPARAAVDAARRDELRAAQTADRKAWKLATSPEAAERDGQQAYKLALEACQPTNYQYWKHLATLAAAYAEAGDFDHAVEWANNALKLAPEKELSTVRRQLARYEAKKPFRD